MEEGGSERGRAIDEIKLNYPKSFIRAIAASIHNPILTFSPGLVC